MVAHLGAARGPGEGAGLRVKLRAIGQVSLRVGELLSGRALRLDLELEGLAHADLLVRDGLEHGLGIKDIRQGDFIARALGDVVGKARVKVVVVLVASDQGGIADVQGEKSVRAVAGAADLVRAV